MESAAQAQGFRLVLTLPDDQSAQVLAYLLTVLAFDPSSAVVVPSEEDLAHLADPPGVLRGLVTVVFADTGERWDRSPAVDAPKDWETRAELLTALAERVRQNAATAVSPHHGRKFLPDI